MKHLSIIVFLLFSISLLFGGCSKDPEVITETVVVKDTIIIHQTDTITDFINDTATTFFLVRHAEKASSGTDPVLTAAGMERADQLSKVLSKISLSAVYSSNYNRTKLTAQPTADAQGLPVTIYNVSDLSGSASEMLNSYHNKSVLVVGHSNTTPDFANILTNSNDFNQFPDSAYDNLIVVSVYNSGRTEVLWLKFGN